MKGDYKYALIYPCAWEKVVLIKDADGHVKVDVQKVDYYDIYEELHK